MQHLNYVQLQEYLHLNAYQITLLHVLVILIIRLNKQNKIPREPNNLNNHYRHFHKELILHQDYIANYQDPQIL